MWREGECHLECFGLGVPAPFGPSSQSDTTVTGVQKLLALMTDGNFNVRCSAVKAVGAYLGTGDRRVVQAMERALDDPKHKVAHAAAKAMGVPCRSCGHTW